MLVDMKKDLDYIFKKIRTIKGKLSSQYPSEFAEAVRNSLAEECREDESPEQIKNADASVSKSEEEANTSRTRNVSSSSESDVHNRYKSSDDDSS